MTTTSTPGARRQTAGSVVRPRNPSPRGEGGDKLVTALSGPNHGFELAMLIESPDGDVRFMHSEMTYGSGRIMVGAEWADWARSPQSLAGSNTQNLHVMVESDIDEHCERARATGAVIDMEPEDQFYGDRTYRAVDPEGHVWTFGQRVREVSREEAEAASGLKIQGWV